MKSYIGRKIIQAEAMDEWIFLRDFKGQDSTSDDAAKSRQGYKVIYPDGYISWSPKDVFETAYREVTDSERELFQSTFEWIADIRCPKGKVGRGQKRCPVCRSCIRNKQYGEAMISQSNNFCRVFELPDEYPGGFCFGGGRPVMFAMVDWFGPIPDEDIVSGNIKPWSDYIPMLKEFLKDKIYVKPGKQYLLITDFGETMLFNKDA